ncbi:MAG: amino acid adenylation domain-containing protein [Bacteroidetes bacterium]|nr:amino acid adenylation domain-containing protein [Bacteroidota bacterium]
MFLERLSINFENYSDNNAFCINDEYYTYAYLKKSIIAIQKQIEDISVSGVSLRIAVVCNDDIRTYSSLLAIWFSGNSYVPLGLHNPIERNLTILKDACVNIIISSVTLDDARYSMFTVIQPEAGIDSLEKIKVPNIKNDQLAYILYTSGSTGVPKGVPITHNSLNSFLNSFEKLHFNINVNDRCLQMFELTFDVSIVSFLVPLLNGACVYTIPDDKIKYLNVLKLMKEKRLTVIQIVPSVIKLLNSLLSRIILPDVRLCILTGEATHIDLLPMWQKALPNSYFCNMYGPTEATIYSTYYKYENSIIKNYNGLLAIGKAMSGIDLVILKNETDFAEVNEKGELCISGEQLTDGYINNIQKNSNSFVELTYKKVKNRFYKTGDLCYFDEEGDFFYCGRLDNQVKIQGFRIELGEIEFLVRNQYNVNNVVVPIENKTGTLGLVLVIENEGLGRDTITIINYLKSILPDYMIPFKVIFIDRFPLTSSGKTDRNKIKTIISGEDLRGEYK